jgi:CubicO group peptidase (beta-lactamase class C family)
MMTAKEKNPSKRHQHPFLLFTSVILIFSTLVGCGPSDADFAAVDYAPLPGDDWMVSTPAEQGLDPNLLAELYYNAAELETIYSLLVIKNGYLIAEDYFNEGSVAQKDRLQSATKSYTSALVGIALEQGCLSSVDQKMLDFFPEVAGKITDPRKEQITIRKMLEMRAGYPWEETDQALWEGLLSGRYPPLIEEFPLVSDPGSRFYYSNLTSNWLGIIVAEGHNNGCGDLHLTARDAAKFGQLYLNDGVYKGNQVVPADWVHDSLLTYSVNEAFVKKGGPFSRYWVWISLVVR